MSEHARSFIQHLVTLRDNDRGALAHLKRSLSFEPGAYPRAYPYVERFVGPDKHADDPRRRALYLAAGLYALHPLHREGVSFATAFGAVARSRDSASLEHRFIALLDAEPDSLPTLLRQTISMLAADSQGCDYADLLDDLTRWCDRFKPEARDALRQRWARDFYRAYEPHSAPQTAADAPLTETTH